LANKEELLAHERYLDQLDKIYGASCLWRSLEKVQIV
jgi:hypothetical protein